MPSSEVDKTLQDIQRISRSTFQEDEEGRLKMLYEVQKLFHRLETPREAILRMSFQEPSLNCALRVADALDIFSTLGPSGSSPKSVQELASPSNADPELVKRILRHCAAKNILLEGENDTYQATEMTETLATECAPIRLVASKFNPAFQNVPEYLKSRGFKVPRDNKDGPFQYSPLGKVGQSHFEWLEKPEVKQVSDDFNLLMQWVAGVDKSWVEAFPTEELVKDIDAQQPLMVDIGGGLGYNSISFKQKHPNIPGQIIVQDLPHVIQQGKDGKKDMEDLKLQDYDFFKPQPIHGAKLYFLGHVLHDWPDEEAEKILKNTVAAMEPGYSELLIKEKILPEKNCNPHLSAIDLIMMAELASHERTDKQWEALLSKQGLKIVRICPIIGTEDSVLHANLV